MKLIAPSLLAHVLMQSIALAASGEAEVRKAEPAASEQNLFPKAKRYAMPDFAQPGEGKEEIKAPEAFTEQEQRVLKSAAEMSAEDLNDLLQVYERMGNAAMQQAISRLILERTPDHPLAKQALQKLDGTAEVRRPDYLDAKASEVLAGKLSTDPEAVAAQAHALVLARQSDEAIKLLEALRETTYRDTEFPFHEDLGYALADRQRWSKAEKEFRDALSQKELDDNAQRRLVQQLDIVRVEKRIAVLRAKTYADPAAALRESEALLKDLPDHPSAIVFRIECLQYAGKSAESLTLLKQLKEASSHMPAFAYQRQLGYTFQQLKQWDEARAIFEELRDNPVFAEDARADASKAMTSSEISKRGEAALMAAGFGEWEKAEALIAELEKEHPGDLEVFSYRCGLLARTQRADEALQLLTDKRAQLAPSGKPFPLQDTLADVYLAQKKFDLARAAYQDILDNPKYDWSMRRRAMDGATTVRRVELMETGFIALRDRRIERAKTAARELSEEFGADSRELKLLRAEILLAQNKAHEAAEQFEELKTTTPKDTPFESGSSLATAYLRTGRAQEAVEAYRDILAHHRAYTPYEAMAARWELRTAMPLTRPNVQSSVARRSEQDGSITRAEATYSSPWWGAWRAQVFTHGDYIQLKSKLTDVTNPSVEDRYEAGVRMQRRISETFAAEATLGAIRNDALYGVRVGNFLAPGLNWSASFAGNARSTESIPLEALDARENRVDFAFGGPLPGPWNLDIRAGANWVRVGNRNVGRGLGGTASLEYLVQTETEKRPEIAIGYLGEYRRFTPSDASSPLSQLVDTKTHRHGLTAAYRQNLSESWRLTADVAALYAFDETSLQFMAGLGIQHYFTDDFMAYLDFRYDSNSRTSLGDGGGWEATMGMSKAF